MKPIDLVIVVFLLCAVASLLVLAVVYIVIIGAPIIAVFTA